MKRALLFAILLTAALMLAASPLRLAGRSMTGDYLEAPNLRHRLVLR